MLGFDTNLTAVLGGLFSLTSSIFAILTIPTFTAGHSDIVSIFVSKLVLAS